MVILMNRFILILFALMLSSCGSKEKDVLKIGINQISDHPALNATVSGIMDKINARKDALKKEVIILHDSANSNFALATQISKDFVSKKVDIIVTVGTITSQAAKSATSRSTIPVVFSSVTSPQNAGLLQNPEAPEGNITGVSNMMNHSIQLKLFKEILPNISKIGVIYNTGEVNSNTNVKLLKEAAEGLDIQIVEGVINKTIESTTTTEYLIQRHNIDAILIDGDNTALSSLPSIVKVANKYSIPVLSTDNDTIDSGVAVAIGCNQYDIGLKTGDIVIDILNKKPIQDIPVQYPEMVTPHINEKSLMNLGISISDEKIKMLNIVRN